MPTGQDFPKSIVDRIYDGLVERIKKDDQFGDLLEQEILKLIEIRGLKSADQIESALESKVKGL